MATKRMFSNIVIDSDPFLDLTPMQQLLYFHCGMKTDDDGFVSGAKRISRIIGATDDDFAALVDSGFLIEFPESKVFCITHHRQNNELKNDRYHKTNYQHEIEQLELTDNKEWKRKQTVSNMDTEWKQDDSGMDTEQNVTQRNPKNVTQKNVTNVSIGKGSDEGETADDERKMTLLMADSLGVLSDVQEAINQHGVKVAHEALYQWREKSKVIGKYNDYVKQILKGEN